MNRGELNKKIRYSGLPEILIPEMKPMLLDEYVCSQFEEDPEVGLAALVLVMIEEMVDQGFLIINYKKLKKLKNEKRRKN